MDAEVLVDYLIRVSDGKLQLVKKLLEWTLKQREALAVVEEEDIEVLNDIIQQKQQVINKIDLLDKEFLEKFQILKDKLGINSFADLSEEPIDGMKDLQGKVQQIIEITEEVNKIDEENMLKAKVNLEKIKQQLKTVKVGKKTNQGYGKKFNENIPILIDKKK